MFTAATPNTPGSAGAPRVLGPPREGVEGRAPTAGTGRREAPTRQGSDPNPESRTGETGSKPPRPLALPFSRPSPPLGAPSSSYHDQRDLFTPPVAAAAAAGDGDTPVTISRMVSGPFNSRVLTRSW